MKLDLSVQIYFPVADPGFPVRRRGPVRGAWTSDMGTFLLKMCAKMKELGPIGGLAPGMPPLDPPMFPYRQNHKHLCQLNTDNSVYVSFKPNLITLQSDLMCQCI